MKKKSNKYSAPPTGFEGRINAPHAQFSRIIIIIIIIIITLFMSQVYLASRAHCGSANWGEGKTELPGEKPPGAE